MVHKHIPADGATDVGLGAVFRSLGSFLELLSDLAAQASGGELHYSGELADEKQGVRAAYGCSVRVGGNERPLIGNLADRAEPVAEPVIDVFDEDHHLLVVVELPGVQASDIELEVREDVLELSVTRGDREYRKEVLLPSAVRAQAATSSYRNGVLVVRLHKEG